MLLSCSRLKRTSVLPSSQAILVTVQVVNCSSRHWNAEVLKYVWSILMTNLGLSWRDAMPLVGSSMPPEGGGRWVLKIWVSRHPNLNWRHLWSESQGHYWSLEKKRALMKWWHLQRGNDIHMKLLIWTCIILYYKHTCIYTFIYRTYSMFQVFTFSLWGIYFLPSGPCRPWIFARKFRGDRFRKPGTHNS